ncbi:MAG: NAD(P)-binding protein [Pseudomonadota bacterium]
MRELETDYLIVGAGAVGMAFADTLLHETDADIILIDRHHKPGGHWNVAYPFVTLHQPSAYYGVASKDLGTGEPDKTGLNRGLADLASGAEILAYYDEVLRHTFLPTGRVRWFGMSDYQGEGVFRSLTSGEHTKVTAKKIVDATWLKTSVPSTHVPAFSIDPSLRFMPLNNLPRVAEPPEGYTIIGAGKTGIDAVLWLLENGVAPDSIRWIMPRDGWLLDRRNAQPGEAFFFDTLGSVANQFEAISAASDIDDMFDRLEACGYLTRIYTDVRPSMFHAATVSQMELEELRKVTNIVRMGRITALEADRIVLEQGEIPTGPNELHVDCSASAVTNEEIVPVFQGDLITPQMVRSYQPVFSASVIAHIEATRDGDKEKNRLCGVVPLPNTDRDFVKFTAAFMLNQYNWGQDEELRAWLQENRLDGFSKLAASVAEDDHEKRAVLKRIRAASMPAGMKLQQFMAQMAE